jgi:predicted dehydrogenase
MSERRSVTHVAVIGAGAISQVVHVPVLSERDDVELLALSDLDEHKARSVAERFGVPEAVGPDGVLDRDDVDAVFLCTPNHLHEDLAVAALEAGKDVFVERPLATTAEGVARVVEVARRTGRVLEVGLPHRFRPEVIAMRSFVAGGKLGDIYAVRGSWLARQTRIVRPGWRQVPEQAGGGALVDLGVPALDLCLWTVGYPEVRRVSCQLQRGDHPVEDSATLLALCDGGMSLSVEVSNRYFAGEDRYYARVMGTEGSGSFPPLSVYQQIGGRPLDVTPNQPRPRGGENPYTNAYRRQIDHFVRASRGRAEAPVPEEQVALMALIEAAYQAAETGEEVTL